MAWFYFKKLRTQLIILVLPAIALVFGLMLYSGVEQHPKALSEAETNCTNPAMELTVVQKTLIEKMHQILITLSQLPQVQELDAVKSSAIFKTIVDQGQRTTHGHDLKGMPCVFGFAPVAFGSKSIYVYVTTPSEVAFAKAHRILLLNLGLSVIVFVLALFAAWLDD
jgi:hypothetical protein